MLARSPSCNCRLLAWTVFALSKPLDVASLAVSKQDKARGTQVGFPIVFDNLPTNVQMMAAPVPAFPADKAERLSSQERTDPSLVGTSRLLRYEIAEHAGIGDRLAVITTLLAIATGFQATLAFPSPTESLGRTHGNTSAQWWDEYVVTEPKILDASTAHCVAGATAYNVTSKDEFESLLDAADSLLFHRTSPLCIRLQVHYFDFMKSQVINDLAIQGAPSVTVWTSSKVSTLAMQVKAELTLATDHFNAMHVRLGDKATPLCQSASRVTEAAYNMTQAHPEYAEEPWFLMSDGTLDFFNDMKDAMLDRGFTLLTEADLVALRAVKDNYLIYSALECVFSASDLALVTYKNIGHRCLPAETHAVNPKFIECRPEYDAAFLYDDPLVDET